MASAAFKFFFRRFWSRRGTYVWLWRDNKPWTLLQGSFLIQFKCCFHASNAIFTILKHIMRATFSCTFFFLGGGGWTGRLVIKCNNQEFPCWINYFCANHFSGFGESIIWQPGNILEMDRSAVNVGNEVEISKPAITIISSAVLWWFDRVTCDHINSASGWWRRLLMLLRTVLLVIGHQNGPAWAIPICWPCECLSILFSVYIELYIRLLSAFALTRKLQFFFFSEQMLY